MLQHGVEAALEDFDGGEGKAHRGGPGQVVFERGVQVFNRLAQVCGDLPEAFGGGLTVCG